MKAAVLRDFRDRETMQVHRAGETYEGTSKRVTELAKLGYVEKPAKRSKK